MSGLIRISCLALALASNLAFAADINPGERAWANKVKACLNQAGVETIGDRPGCSLYRHETKGLTGECLTPKLGAIFVGCHKQARSSSGRHTRVDW